MPSSRSDWPAAPGFHPEFGLFCPSPRRRRVLRLVALSAVTAVAIGATIGLAGAHRPDLEGLAATAQPIAPPAVVVSATGLEARRLRGSCKPDGALDLAALFFNSACGWSKLHARHGGRAANRVATVIIGRTDVASTAATTPAPLAATAPSHGDGASAEKSAALTMAAVERTAPPKTPKLKASASITAQARELTRQNSAGDAAMAYAATPKFRRDSFIPYGDTFRFNAPQSGFDARFGGIR